ncbi:hypothetical protein ACRQ5Q_10960 [Bradyrhizobium sp. PMVTL-01]|uniref:hypothetical protein n=1 Tax=Bradyrhizobium sp. PMVTL-01 TaxID=3434999 RepID=UPI003F700D74
MLRIHAYDYVFFGTDLVWLREKLEAIEHRWSMTTPGEDGTATTLLETAPEALSAEQQEFSRQAFETLGKRCREVGLPVTAALAERAIEIPPKTAAEIDALIAAFAAELKSLLFLFVPNHLAKFYELTLQNEIAMAFPHASKEIVAAGNCLASGLFTASVFHSMRAAEIGVRVLGAELGVSFPDKPLELAEWQQILDQSESKIKAMKALQPKQRRDEELNFYSQAAVQFTYFKDAWRVRVAHARETYDENPATRVLNHTIEFFEVLSTRLKEPSI